MINLDNVLFVACMKKLFDHKSFLRHAFHVHVVNNCACCCCCVFAG